MPNDTAPSNVDVPSNVEVVRACMQAYVSQDRETAEKLIAAGYVFTSPQDDHIDRQAFFDRCFPTMDRVRSQLILQVAAGEVDDVFILYEYVLMTGQRHRNAEVSTVRDGQLVETQVYFGGRF
jgi:hypothetical protein